MPRIRRDNTKQEQPLTVEPARLALVPRRGLRREDAALYVGVSPRKFDQLVKDGRMPKPGRIDGVVLWDLRQLDLAMDDVFRHDAEAEPNPWDE
jgi:predicted DNA-binding transcriptional regulator AlpA